MTEKTSIVDIFAGPGGLGEGFSAFKDKKGNSPFSIKVSIEKEPTAHRTLELRSFIRKFESPPDEYYKFVKGKLSRDELYAEYKEQSDLAIAETLYGPKELGPEGNDDEYIYKHLNKLRKNNSGPWVVIGGPPCQAYSLVGRARNKGNSAYKANEDNRHFLYKEYLKVLATIRPAVFVMENVKGILSSKINEDSIFPRILDDLRCPVKAMGQKRATKTSKYKIYSLVTGNEIDNSAKDAIIRSENYGVPQARHRVILIGVREDISSIPTPLTMHTSEVAFGKCISDLPRLRSGLTRMNGKKIDDSCKHWLEALRSNEPLIRTELDKLDLNVGTLSNILKKSENLISRGGDYVSSQSKFTGPDFLNNWLTDPNLKGVLNHETKGHMSTDLARYFFCAIFADLNKGNSPTSKNFPKALAPDHKSWESGKFADRFRVLDKSKPAKTITSHIAKDGHAFIHYDPSQCRSMTVREAARIQTFPDNYFFEGHRTAQSIQVGNAVPPYLSLQIAKIVYELIT